MTDLEIKSFHKKHYYALLDALKLVKYEDPSSYNTVAKLIEVQRQRIIDEAEIDSLPPVPKFED